MHARNRNWQAGLGGYDKVVWVARLGGARPLPDCRNTARCRVSGYFASKQPALVGVKPMVEPNGIEPSTS